MGVQDPFDPRYSAEKDGSVAVDNDNPIEIANKQLEKGLVPAVTTIIQLAQHAEAESLRLKAAQYVVDRNLGRINTKDTGDSDPWSKLLAGITRAEDEAIQNHRDSFRPPTEGA